MSRRFLLLLSILIPVVGHSQVIVGNYGIQYVSAAPSGSCSSTAPIQVATSTGTIYTCQSGSWAAVSGGGGGNGFPITLGSTSIASGSTTTSISGLSLAAPALGTPASVVLTNATGLPISTGVSGLATGVAAFLATPTSANLATAVTNETGTTLLVFNTSPTLVTPILGTPTSVTLTNATGLPLTTGVTGLLPHANIAATAVTPGSYTSANITVAADGSITAAANGSGGSGPNLHIPRDYNFHYAVANPDRSAYSEIGLYTGNSTGTLTAVTTPDAAGYPSLSQTTTATINTPVGTVSTKTMFPLNNPTFEAIFHVSSITSMNMWVGMCSSCNATDAGFTDLGVQAIAEVGFRFIAGTDTNWACYASDKSGTTGQSSATTVAPSITQMQKFDVIYVSGTPTYYINNTQVCASFVPTQLPTTSTAMGAEVVWKNLTAAAIVGNTYALYYGAN